MATRKLIRADGTTEEYSRPLSMREINTKINTNCIDTVRLKDREHVMIVDDNGHFKGLPVNTEATRLYHEVCRPGTTHQIVGDVVVVPDVDFLEAM